MVNYHRSAAHRLPPETLAMVASHLADDKSLIIATQVCHLWRSTFLASPCLWSRIDITNEQLALVFLRRSKSAPVSVCFRLNGALSVRVRESLKGITHRLAGLEGAHSEFLDELLAQPLPTLRKLDVSSVGGFLRKQSKPSLPSLRSLTVFGPGYSLPYAPHLTNFSFDPRLPTAHIGSLGGSLLDFFRSCPMLEVVFLRYGDPNTDIEFTTDQASTGAVPLPCIRSFTHETPFDTIHIGLFDRLSLPLTCDVTFTVTIRDHSIGPWFRSFPPPRNPAYLSDVRAVKTTVDSHNAGTSDHTTYRVEFLNSKNMRITFIWVTACPSGYLSSLMTERLLEYLGRRGMTHSVESLRFEQYPVSPRQGIIPAGGFTGGLQTFGRLKTLVLWQCNSVLFLEDLPPPAVWCPSVKKLVIFHLPRHPWGPAESDVLNRVQWVAASRRKYGTPLKTVTLYFQDVEKLSQACRRQIKELRNSVELMEVVGLSV